MAIMSTRLIRHEMCKEELIKLGASVLDIQGIMFLVKFTIHGFKITYAYYVNEDGTYLVERVKPYFMSVGIYEYEEDIVDTIRYDIEQYKNAMKSSNFEQFIEIDNHISKLVRLFEDLYLYYNIESDDLKQIDNAVDCILDNIKDIMRRSDRIYTKKDPEVLSENFEF